MDKFHLDAKQQVLELVNLKNTLPIPITADNVMLSEAVPLSESDLVEVGIRGGQDGGYRKTPVRVLYQRIDLETLFGGAYTPEITTLSQSSLYVLLPRLNAILGTRFTVNDVDDIDITSFGNDPVVQLHIKTSMSSKFYSGAVSIIFNRRRILLEEVVNPHLNILRHPDPVSDGRISVGLLTWGLDFTPLRDLLEVDPVEANYRGAFIRMDELRQALGMEYGIWGWPDNRDSIDVKSSIRDYDVRDVERANKNFQRVVVQTNVRQNEYIGTAYFHYNLP